MARECRPGVCIVLARKCRPGACIVHPPSGPPPIFSPCAACRATRAFKPTICRLLLSPSRYARKRARQLCCACVAFRGGGRGECLLPAPHPRTALTPRPALPHTCRRWRSKGAESMTTALGDTPRGPVAWAGGGPWPAGSRQAASRHVMSHVSSWQQAGSWPGSRHKEGRVLPAGRDCI